MSAVPADAGCRTALEESNPSCAQRIALPANRRLHRFLGGIAPSGPRALAMLAERLASSTSAGLYQPAPTDSGTMHHQ